MRDFVFLPLVGCKKPVSASEKEMEWAQMACHRCLVYLGDLGKRASSGEGTLVCRKSGHSAGLPPTAGVLSDAFVGDRRGRSAGFALHAAVAPWVLRTASLSFSAVCLDGVWCRMAAEAEMFCIGPPQSRGLRPRVGLRVTFVMAQLPSEVCECVGVQRQEGNICQRNQSALGNVSWCWASKLLELLGTMECGPA